MKKFFIVICFIQIAINLNAENVKLGMTIEQTTAILGKDYIEDTWPIGDDIKKPCYCWMGDYLGHKDVFVVIMFFDKAVCYIEYTFREDVYDALIESLTVKYGKGSEVMSYAKKMEWTIAAKDTHMTIEVSLISNTTRLKYWNSEIIEKIFKNEKAKESKNFGDL